MWAHTLKSSPPKGSELGEGGETVIAKGQLAFTLVLMKVR